MGWERRGVAVAAAGPTCLVGAHALASLQASWVGPPLALAPTAIALSAIAAGLAVWLKPGWAVGGVAAGAAGGGLAAGGMLPWGFLPGVVLCGACIGAMTPRIARVLPDTVDGTWNRSRGKALAWAALALLMVAQVSRLSVFMTDHDRTWASTFPFVEFTITHMCMASYVHAADLAHQNDPNLYDVEHYPSFGITDAEDIETTIAGLQPYLADSFHYPPPFLLLPSAWLALSNDYLTIRSVWFAIQILSFVAFAVWLARWAGGKGGARALWLLPLVLASMPTMINFQFGQIHLFTVWTAMAAMLAFDVERPALGGLLLAGGIASKLFPGILVLFLLVRRRWRDLAWTAGFSLGFALLSVVLIGTAPFAQFFQYLLPRLSSGEAFSFVTGALVVTTNMSIPGWVWKLDYLGFDNGDSLLGPASTLYTVFVLAVTWYAARIDTDRIGRAQIWLAVLILASLRSPLVPIYGVAPVLWLMTLELDRVDTVKAWVAFGASWVFLSSIPPAPNPIVTIALYSIAQIAMLYWVLRPLRRRPPCAERGFVVH